MSSNQENGQYFSGYYNSDGEWVEGEKIGYEKLDPDVWNAVLKTNPSEVKYWQMAAYRYKLYYLEMKNEVRKANKGLARLHAKLDRMKRLLDSAVTIHRLTKKKPQKSNAKH